KHRFVTHRAQIGSTEDVRNQDHQEFVVRVAIVLLPKEISQYWKIGQARKTGELPALFFVGQPPENTHFAIFHADVRLIDLLADFGLVDSGDQYLLYDVRDLHLYVHGNVLGTANMRCEIDVGAHV